MDKLPNLKSRSIVKLNLSRSAHNRALKICGSRIEKIKRYNCIIQT